MRAHPNRSDHHKKHSLAPTINRRGVLHGLIGAGLMTALAPTTRSALAQSKKQVSIDGLPVRVIDIHAHCVVPSVASLLADSAFADVPFKAWQALSGARLEEMDRRGIDLQVLSINRYWWYAAEQKLASKVVQHHDEALAAWCEAHPTRFRALSSVALSHPELAARQLTYAVEQLGLRGASIGGHVLREPLSARRFDAFWERAEALGVPVFMHPTNGTNIARDGAWDGNGDLGNIVGNPLETTVFLSRMIFDGVLDRFPGLRICAPHAGGYLPSYLGRTEVACKVRRNANCQNKKPPSNYLKQQILVDSMVFSEEGLRHLVSEVGASQVVYGSDLPFNWPDTIDLIVQSPSLTSSQKRAILSGNLERLLRFNKS